YRPRDPSDLELLQNLRSQGIPVVSLFITGRPLWVNPHLNASDAFVTVWQPGTEGQGVADVIFRNEEGGVNYDLRGRLSFSWPKTPDQGPLNRGDENYDPLFPYGYGLSYSDESSLGDDLPETGLELAETQDRLELFARRALDPYVVEIIGNANDREVVTTNTLSVSPLRIEAVDRNEQKDARRVVWNGKGSGQVALIAEDRK